MKTLSTQRDLFNDASTVAQQALDAKTPADILTIKVEGIRQVDPLDQADWDTYFEAELQRQRTLGANPTKSTLAKPA